MQKKKQAFDEYKEKKAIERFNKEKTRQLQQKLEREATIQEGKSSRQELKKIRQYEHAKKDIAALKAYQREQNLKNSTIGKIGSGLESKNTYDPFAGMFGTPKSRTKKSRTKKSRKKRKK